MRLVKQADKIGCGIACVAMLTGQTYAQVRRSLFGAGKIELTSATELRALLGDGGRVAGRMIPFGDKTLEDLPFDALVAINPKQGGSVFHWVVWDSTTGKMLDPRKQPYKRIKLISYMRISDASLESSPTPDDRTSVMNSLTHPRSVRPSSDDR